MMVLLILLVIIVSPEVFSRELPSYIKKCHLNDPHINDCIIENIRVSRPYLIKGIQELKIPPIDPLELKQLGFDMNTFHARFTNGTIGGATNFELRELQFDYAKKFFRIVFFIPNVYLSGDFNVDGKLLIVQVKTAGHGIGEIHDVVGTAELKGYLEERQGKSYINFNESSLKLDVNPNSYLHFDNLFPGNEELTEATNKILNENMSGLIEEFMPLIEDMLSSFTVKLIVRIFKIFSINELFIID